MPFVEVDYNPFEPQEENKEDMPWQEVATQAVKNVPADLVDIGKGILEMVKHPVETVKGIDGLVMGAVQKAIPGEQEHEKYADALTKELTDRYGSIENIKNTIATEPVKFMMDMSLALGATGKAMQAGGMVKAGKVVSKAGDMVEPVGAVKSMVKAAIPEKLPGRMYQSAAKISTTVEAPKRAKMADLALDKGVMPTSSGLDKLKGMIDDLNTKVTTIIDDATTSGKVINKDDLFVHFDDLRADAALTGTPKTNLSAIDRIEAQIKSVSGKTLTPAEAQRLKQNIYRDINTAYGKMSVPYRVEAQKSVARAAKEELESLHPELKNLNAREGELIELYDAIGRSVNRIDNRDLMGIGVPIKGTMGAAAAGPAGAAAMLSTSIIDTPRVKAALAIALRKAKKAKIGGVSASARKATYAAEQTTEEEP